MDFMAVNGKNNKQFIQIWNAQPKELEYFKLIEQIVSRREYLPYSKGFNKWKSESYFINSTFIPSPLWHDVKVQMEKIIGPINLQNEEILKFPIDREEFDDYIFSLPLPEKYDITIEKYAYQPNSVYECLTNKCARIEVGTGGGKTLTTYLYCRYLFDKVLKPDQKILIIVPRQDLVKQSKRDFTEYDEFNPNKVIVESIYCGATKYLDSNIVVGTYQSLSNYDEDYFDDFAAIICDEVHTGKTYSVRTGIYDKCRNAIFYFGMTGTSPEYPTLDYLNITAMFGPVVLKKKTWELIRDGNVVPVNIRAIEIYYTDEWKDYSKNLVKDGIVGNEKYRAEKAFFENFEPRNQLIAKLCNAFEGNHLILVESVEFCKFLKEFLQACCPSKYVDIIHGKIRNREEIKDTMRNRSDMILIATYETMSTGISIPSIWHVHFPDGGKSPFRINQGTGRSLRLDLPHGKTEANVFDYQDIMQGSSFLNHARYRNNIYAQERFPVMKSKVTIG